MYDDHYKTKHRSHGFCFQNYSVADLTKDL